MQVEDAVDVVPYPTPSKSLLEQLLAAYGDNLGTPSRSPAKPATSLAASCGDMSAQGMSAVTALPIATWAPLLLAIACNSDATLLAQAFLKLLDSAGSASSGSQFSATQLHHQILAAAAAAAVSQHSARPGLQMLCSPIILN